MSYPFSLCGFLLILLSSFGSTAIAQLDQDDDPRDLEQEVGPVLGDSNVSYWEFGLKTNQQGDVNSFS